MKIAGSNVVPFPVDRVWEALLDPRVLVATIPGCERLEVVGEHRYAMTVSAGVAAIKGTYSGSCALSDLDEHESLVMRLQGAGAPGTIDASVRVYFGEPTPGQTKVDYEADAVVGGMVGGVGQRMLTSVSKRMAGEFFANVASTLVDQPAVDQPAVQQPVVEQSGVAQPVVEQRAPASVVDTPAARGAVFTRPGAARATTGRDDFLRGVAVGAGLVLIGVVAGAVLGGRR